MSESKIKWARINNEPFEYAIQQGPHGDEFVKLLDGSCLHRPAEEKAKQLWPPLPLAGPAATAGSAEAMRKALEKLENANDALAGLRTPEMYLAMLDAGQEFALAELDDARRAARAALAAPQAQETATPPSIEQLRTQAFELTPADQYRLAFFIAENVGYILIGELDHPDSPHDSAVHRYAAEYEFRGDGGDYVPTENERAMIEDAIEGYIATSVTRPNQRQET